MISAERKLAWMREQIEKMAAHHELCATEDTIRARAEKDEEGARLYHWRGRRDALFALKLRDLLDAEPSPLHGTVQKESTHK